MTTRPRYEPADDIELRARDELPETFDALVTQVNWGPGALGRRKEDVMYDIWAAQLDPDQVSVLAVPVKAYAGKKLARSMIGPGIEYWNQQLTSQSAGTQEQASYLDRTQALKELDKRLAAEIAELLIIIGPITPPVRTVAGSAPHVQQAGKLTTAVPGTLFTPDPFDMPPAYGPPEETT